MTQICTDRNPDLGSSGPSATAPKAPPDGALLGISTLVLTLLGWSSIPLFLKSFIHEIDGWTANGWRYAFSAVIWAPMLLWAYRAPRAPAGLWRAALVPSLFNIAGQAL